MPLEVQLEKDRAALGQHHVPGLVRMPAKTAVACFTSRSRRSHSGMVVP